MSNTPTVYVWNPDLRRTSLGQPTYPSSQLPAESRLLVKMCFCLFYGQQLGNTSSPELPRAHSIMIRYTVLLHMSILRKTAKIAKFKLLRKS